jgi:hypothetical protein
MGRKYSHHSFDNPKHASKFNTNNGKLGYFLSFISNSLHCSPDAC